MLFNKAKNQFLNRGKVLNCHKCNYTIFLNIFRMKVLKKFVKLIDLISRVFGLDFFKFSGLLCFLRSQEKKRLLIEAYLLNFFPNFSPLCILELSINVIVWYLHDMYVFISIWLRVRRHFNIVSTSYSTSRKTPKKFIGL